MDDLTKPKILLLKELQELRELVSELLERENRQIMQDRNIQCRENETSFGDLLPSDPAGSFIVDAQGQILDATPDGLRLLGNGAGDSMGEDLGLQLSRDVSETLGALLSRTPPCARQVASVNFPESEDGEGAFLSVYRMRLSRRPRSEPLFLVTFWKRSKGDGQDAV